MTGASTTTDGGRLSKRDALLLGLFALVIRCLYNAEHSNSAFFGVPLLDQKYYDLFARTIAAGGDWSSFGGFRPMLYPLFLGGLYKLGGADGMALAFLVQHALGALTVLFIAFAAAGLSANRRAGIAAGVLYALAGPPLFFEGELLIEAIFPFLVAAVLHAHVKAARSERSVLPWLVGGALVAVACQARPNLLFFWCVYPVLGLVRFARDRRPAAWLPLAGLAAAFAGQVLFGALNMKQAGGFHLVTGAGGINFYLGNNLRADGMIPRQAWSVTYHGDYRDPIEVFAEEDYRRAMRRQDREPSADPQEISRFWTQQALGEIRADPARWLGLMLRKAWLLVWNYEAPNNTSYLFVRDHESRLLRLLPVTWSVLLALAVAGTVRLWRREPRDALAVLLVFLASYAATIALFFVNGRFRIPLWPAMAVLAGCGAEELLALLRSRDWRRAARRAVPAALAGVASSINWPGTAVPDYARDFMFRSKALHDRGQNEAALQDIGRSLALDPSDMNAAFHLGNVLFALGRVAEARDVYAKVAPSIPDEPRVWNNLGAACDLLGDFPAAHSNYLRSVTVEPRFNDGQLNLALLEVRAGRTAQAESRLAQTGACPDSLVYLCVRAHLDRLKGDDRSAGELADRARRLDPEKAGQLFRLLEESAARPVGLEAGAR